MARLIHFKALAGSAAAFSMIASPIAASAAELPHSAPVQTRSDVIPAPGVFSIENDTAQRHRDYRYRSYRHRHRGIDAGDVLAGVLIIGGIAAIANAAESKKRDRDYRDSDYRYRDRDYRDRDYYPRRGDSRYEGGRGIDNAVRMCVNEIERDVRVNSVDGVDRTGDGWLVSGSLYNDDGFTCRIGPDGRISDIDFIRVSASEREFSEAFDDGEFKADRAAAGQWSDDRYAAARASTDTARVPAREVDIDEVEESGAAPAYPGGPLPGEADGGEDDRYRTAEAPDFTG